MIGKKLLGGIFAAGLLITLAPGCGAANKAMGSVPGGVPGAPGKCPDLTKPESIISFDFAGEFKLDAPTAAKLKASTAAAVDITGFSDEIDADLVAGCGPIAKDLGQTGDFKDGQSACNAAIKGIADFKAKIGAGAKIGFVVKPPRCKADMNVYADCAGKCDASISGGKAKVECEPGKLSGKCDAQCDGSCNVEAGAACSGTCSGSCDAQVTGTCSGNCNGKCDGKNSSGACAGTCTGKCDGKISGSCSGKCGGECKLKAAASCSGSCTGKCSAEFKEPKCTGEVIPPKMSADCKAHCDASVSAKAECTPAQVGISITGGADAQAVTTLKGTLEKNLPLVLKVAIGQAERAPKVALNGKLVVQGGLDTIASVSGKGGVSSATTGAHLTACLADTFKGAINSVAKIQGNVSVSASVSASASGSAGGGAGGHAAPVLDEIFGE